MENLDEMSLILIYLIAFFRMVGLMQYLVYIFE
jgi:hypothetical protein